MCAFDSEYKKTRVLSSRMEWCIISTFNTTTMSKTHRKLNSSQLPGLGKTRRTCCYWMFCWQWRNQRNSMSKCHSAGQLWPALELHTHTYMFSDCKTLFHYFNFCLLQIHSDTFNHQSSIGACRCHCCSCECLPSCSVLCSPKPWSETKIELAQIFLHRP